MGGSYLGWETAAAYGQLKTVTTPLGKTQTYGYDAGGNLSAIISPLGSKATLSFNAAGLPVTVTDPRGNEAGASPASFTTTIAYDAADRQASVKDPKGGVVLNTYDPAGNLKTVTDALGRVTTYTYDPANRITSTTSPGPLTTAFTYDAAGRLASQTDGQGGKTTYGYDKAGRITTMTTPRGNTSGATPAAFTWTYGYDTAGRQTAMSDPTGQVWTTGYDSRSRPASVTDPLGNTTTSKYDESGNLAERTDALGKKASAVFDKANQLISLEDANGNTLTFGYDADGNRTSETSPLGFKSSFGYDVAGRLVSRVEPRGNVTGADPAQFTWRTGYDAAGNVISQTDPLGNTVASAYDALNNLTEQTDPQGKKTSYVYDALSRAVQVTAPDGGVTKTAFDAAGNLAARTDANQRVTTFEYDKAGRRTKVTDPLNRATQYAYDPDGNRIQITNARGQTATSLYDSRGLLTSSSYTDGTPKVSYTYDNARRTATISDGSGTRTVPYDRAGRPLAISAPGSANPFTYTYRADGSVASRTYPDGRSTSYAYDVDGRMTGQTQNNRTTTYGWDQAGNLLTTVLPTTPATTETRAYDQAGRMSSMSEGGGVRQFARDGSGRVTTETYKDATTTGYPKRYEYDSAGRVTRACSDTATNVSCLPGTTGEHYGYDKVGNRLTAASGATTTSSVYDAANQMTSSTTGGAVTNFTYDADGNQTKDVTGTYTYDVLGRVKSSTVGADTFTFVYDADGNRTAAKKNGALQRSTQWDVNTAIPRAATDLSATGTLLGDTHYGPLGEPQSLDTTTSSFFYLHDRQNSITAVRDLNGVDTYKYTYGTWGNVTGIPAGGSQQRSSYGYAGTIKDPFLTGRSQLPARSYDAKTGRFTTPDPRPDTAQPASSSTYAYADNDPVNQSDPSGACPLCVSAGIGAAIGAVVEGGIYSWQHRNGGFTAWGLTKAAGRGAVIGGISGLLMPGAGNLAARGLGLTGARALAASTAVNAGVGAGFSYALNEANCRPTDPWDLLLGAAGGAGSSLIGPAFSAIRGLWAPTVRVSAHSSSQAFRSLRLGEGPGASLVRPGARADMEPWQHVLEGTNSPWISLTLDPRVMIGTYGADSATAGRGLYGYIAVDLNRVDSEVVHAWQNLSAPSYVRDLYGVNVQETAFRDMEVLAKFRLDAEAITHYWPPGTDLQQILRDVGWK
ncbi:RHS repeat-associated core domain-containing protein [Streptomyces sp. NPDC059982]|uniref:RHS repeat-associated core domain-containing protein n=1 Tax=unclassified Streptomyces TaxID=2593676 RepID=UPI0036AA5DA9